MIVTPRARMKRAGTKKASAQAAAPMNAKQQRFVAEYLVDLNATAAYRRAGYTATGQSAGVNAARLLATARVSAAIAEARGKMAKKLEISAERVMTEAWNILTADARELVEYRVSCCRHCWGAGFRYQRTANEMERARAALAQPAAGVKAMPFDSQGGAGFDARRDPNPACPECFGEGQGRALVNDTRRLSPGAASLYAGVRQTKDGVEVKFHSKVDALEKLFKHLGLYDRIRVGDETGQVLRTDSTASLAARGRAILAAAASGEVPAGQAAQLLAGLGTLAKLIETDELAARIAALEEKHGNAA